MSILFLGTVLEAGGATGSAAERKEIHNTKFSLKFAIQKIIFLNISLNAAKQNVEAFRSN